MKAESLIFQVAFFPLDSNSPLNELGATELESRNSCLFCFVSDIHSLRHDGCLGLNDNTAGHIIRPLSTGNGLLEPTSSSAVVLALTDCTLFDSLL